MQHGKKYRGIAEKLDKDKTYSVEEAVKMMKENRVAKFDESVEVHAKLNLDSQKSGEQLRGTVVLPNGIGKTKKIAVITSKKENEAKEAGADVVGGEELINEIKNGKVNFEVLVATPEMMPKLASVAKILGPKGLMPSPKTETVTDKIKEAVTMLKKGKMSFKNDPQAIVHQVIGKISFDEAKLSENFKAFVEALEKAKPAVFKGKLIASVTLCSTMGPGIKISL